MKRPLVGVWWVASLVSARAEIIFQGYMNTSEGSRFVLSADKAETSGWLGVGDTFNGFTLLRFDPKAEVLTLEKDGKRSVIHIVDGRTRSTNGEQAGAAVKPIVI